MGYSISVKCKSRTAQREMLVFLSTHFEHWRAKEPRFVSDPRGDLDYSSKSNQIGFNYNGLCDTAERDYYFSFLRWVAIQVGATRESFNFDGERQILGEPSRYIIYDGYEYWPVILDRPKVKRLREFWVDKYGVHRDLNNSIESYLTELFCQHLMVVKNKGKRAEDVSLREGAEELLGRKVESKNPMGLGFWFPDVTHEEKILLVKKLLRTELDTKLKSVRDKLKKLDRAWAWNSR